MKSSIRQPPHDHATRGSSLPRLAAALALAGVATLAPLERAAAASCEVSTSGIDFGTYNKDTPAPLDTTAWVTVACSVGAPYLVGFDSGLHYQSPWRRQQGGSSYLPYQLYLDSGRTQVWGMTPGADMLAGAGTGTAQNIQVHGRIPARQEVPDGAYSDTVSIAIEFTP